MGKKNLRFSKSTGSAKLGTFGHIISTGLFFSPPRKQPKTRFSAVFSGISAVFSCFQLNSAEIGAKNSLRFGQKRVFCPNFTQNWVKNAFFRVF
jgi:hypothetical protein